MKEILTYGFEDDWGAPVLSDKEPSPLIEKDEKNSRPTDKEPSPLIKKDEKGLGCDIVILG